MASVAVAVSVDRVDGMTAAAPVAVDGLPHAATSAPVQRGRARQRLHRWQTVLMGSLAWLCQAIALLVPWLYVDVVNVDGSTDSFKYTVLGVSELQVAVDCRLNYPAFGRCENYNNYAYITFMSLVTAFAVTSVSLLLEVKGMYHIERGDYAPRLFRWGARLSIFACIGTFVGAMTWVCNFSDGFRIGGLAPVGYYIRGFGLYRPPHVCDHVAWTLLNITTPIESVVVSSVNTDCLNVENIGFTMFAFVFVFMHVVWSHSKADSQAKEAQKRAREQRALAVVRSTAGGPELSSAEVAAAASMDDLERNPALVAWRLKKNRHAAPAEEVHA
jgi:hypothetical protein